MKLKEKKKKRKKAGKCPPRKVISAGSSTDFNSLFVRIVRALIFSTFP